MRLIGAALALTVTVCAAVAWTVESRVEDIETTLEKKPVSVTDTWRSGGATVTVTTKRKENSDGTYSETTAQWKARHDADVAEAKAVYPENQP